jgi:hypothetical protein
VTLFAIVEAVAHPDHTVTVTWSDGVRAVVDFLPIIDRGGWFTPLRDAEYFTATMVALPAGAGLTWPEEMDYSADFLRQVAFPNGKHSHDKRLDRMMPRSSVQAPGGDPFGGA